MPNISISANIPALEIGINAKSRANLDLIHLNSANLFVQYALSIEIEYCPSQNPPQEAINSYMSFVSSSIICSIAALEAKINQFLVDNQAKIDEMKIENNSAILKHYPSVFNPEAPIVKQLLSLSNALIKYNVVFYLLKSKFLPDNKFYKVINFEIKVRNALIHFSPEWDNELITNKKLEDKYFNHFSNDFCLSKFYNKDEFFIPYRCLSASHAEWVYKNSNDFMNKFFSSITSS